MATASEWWIHLIGQDVQDTTDYTGRAIKKAAYNQQGSQYGWVLEYKMPLDKGGSDSQENIWIVSCEAHALRQGKITYTIDGKRYQVQRNGQGGYSIYMLGNKLLSIWEREFGDVTEAEDFTGRTIQKAAYGQDNSRYGWDIDHIQPESLGGKDSDDNKQIVHVLTNREKGSKITFVSSDGQKYQVKKASKVDPMDWANDYDYTDKKYCMVAID